MRLVQRDRKGVVHRRVSKPGSPLVGPPPEPLGHHHPRRCHPCHINLTSLVIGALRSRSRSFWRGSFSAWSPRSSCPFPPLFGHHLRWWCHHLAQPNQRIRRWRTGAFVWLQEPGFWRRAERCSFFLIASRREWVLSMICFLACTVINVSA